jgi:hypothetical protein
MLLNCRSYYLYICRWQLCLMHVLILRTIPQNALLIEPQVLQLGPEGLVSWYRIYLGKLLKRLKMFSSLDFSFMSNNITLINEQPIIGQNHGSFTYYSWETSLLPFFSFYLIHFQLDCSDAICCSIQYSAEDTLL